jgi:hypothetical protein
MTRGLAAGFGGGLTVSYEIGRTGHLRVGAHLP